MPARTTTRLVPPTETSGSGTPVSGSRPRAAPMLMAAWPTRMLMMPTASSLPNSSRQDEGDLERRPGEEHVAADEQQQTRSRPSSSPMMPVIMSVLCSGKKPNFCTELPRPTPKKCPEAIEMSAWVACQLAPC